jgi:hypothetical protein
LIAQSAPYTDRLDATTGNEFDEFPRIKWATIMNLMTLPGEETLDRIGEVPQNEMMC